MGSLVFSSSRLSRLKLMSWVKTKAVLMAMRCLAKALMARMQSLNVSRASSSLSSFSSFSSEQMDLCVLMPWRSVVSNDSRRSANPARSSVA